MQPLCLCVLWANLSSPPTDLNIKSILSHHVYLSPTMTPLLNSLYLCFCVCLLLTKYPPLSRMLGSVRTEHAALNSHGVILHMILRAIFCPLIQKNTEIKIAVIVCHCVHLKTSWLSLFGVCPLLRSTQNLENNLKYVFIINVLNLSIFLFCLLNIAFITVNISKTIGYNGSDR